ncbi:Ku protein [Leptospira interrogans]
MPRAYWKGHLKLSLVSIPVELFNAVDSSAGISFRQIHKPSGRRINYEKVVQGVGKVDNVDIVKGYETGKDTYVILEPDEIEAIKLESKKTLDLTRFVDAKDVDYRYFERPYFLTPADQFAMEGYVVIRDALRKTGKVGLGQLTISGREWLVAVAPLQDGLMLEMLRYANELKDPAEFFDKVPEMKPPKEMIDLAVQLIDSKAGPFKADEFEDHYATALTELVQTKVKGQAILAPPEAAPARTGKVVNLMEALKRSLEGEAGAKKKPATRKKKTG